MSCNSNSDYTNNLKIFENRRIIITKQNRLLMNSELRKTKILNPLDTLEDWMKEVSDSNTQPNPNCMSIATVDSTGSPNSRMVLCKELDAENGFLTFYTNYSSIKSEELKNNSKCSALFHWDKFGYQVRLKGFVDKCADSKNDAYFSTRDIGSQIAAWASDQSKEIESLEKMEDSYQKIMNKFQIKSLDEAKEIKLPRPDFWGGYDLWIEEIELWKNRKNRFHDRLKFKRKISIENGKIDAEKKWDSVRIQP